MPTYRQKAVQVAAEHIKNVHTAEAGEEHTSKEKQTEVSKQADVAAKTYYEEQHHPKCYQASTHDESTLWEQELYNKW